MTTSRTSAELREEIRARGLDPHGPERVARAEGLVADAEKLADAPAREGRAALAEALLHLAASRATEPGHQGAAEAVDRAVRLREAHPEAFDEEAGSALLWSLRWAVEEQIADPAVPASRIEERLAAMGRRYAGAGLSQRAVHAREFLAARSFGDRTRAARAHDAWLAAERDGSADCAGCELVRRGQAHAEQAREADAAEPGSGTSDDEAALRLWEPVLRGDYPCRDCQPDLLAASLAPLLRLGRLDEARSRHVAGQLLVRDAPAARLALARHLSFCARTGNEPRGLEILADRDVTWWQPHGDAVGHGAWTAAVALLARRLTELGHGNLAVPGPPDRGWTAASLAEHAAGQARAVAERFDARAGSTHHTAALHTVWSPRPQAARLPLGVGAVTLPPPDAAAPTPVPPGTLGGTATAAPPGVATAAPVEPAAGEGHRLLAEARRLSALGHPQAAGRWAAAEDAVTREGAAPGAGERAELLDHHAMRLVLDDPAAAASEFTEAAGLFAAAGLPGEALACRARAAHAAFLAPRDEAVPAASAGTSIDGLCDEARGAHAEGRVGTRHATAVLLTRARMRAHELGVAADDGEEDGTPFDAARGAPDALGPAADALDAELADLIALAEPDRDEPQVRARIAEATETRGRLAVQRGAPARAAELLAGAVDLFHEAGRPWAATGPELALARLLMETGDHKRADEVLREALGEDHPERLAARTPHDLVRLHLLHADAHAAQGLLADEAASLRCAIAELLTGQEPHSSAKEGDAARARLRLGGCLLALEQTDEAAAVLVSALEGLLGVADETGIVQACVWLGHACGRPEQMRQAARLLHRAAAHPHPWQDRHGRAVVTHLAADTQRAGHRYAAAAELYEQAAELWRALDDPHALIRTLHARAWLAMEAGDEVTESLRYMAAAQEEINTLLHGADAELDEEQELRLRLETGHTWRQTAELLIEPVAVPVPGEQGEAARERYERGIAYADRAVAAFRTCGEAGLHEATGAELRAAGLEADLGRYDEAVARLTRVRATYPEGAPDPQGTIAERMSEAGALEVRIESAYAAEAR